MYDAMFNQVPSYGPGKSTLEPRLGPDRPIRSDSRVITLRQGGDNDSTQFTSSYNLYDSNLEPTSATAVINVTTDVVQIQDNGNDLEEEGGNYFRATATATATAAMTVTTTATAMAATAARPVAAMVAATSAANTPASPQPRHRLGWADLS
ncbi:hypothetical protein V8E54_009764 [Elaphomyces granulatus]